MNRILFFENAREKFQENSKRTFKVWLKWILFVSLLFLSIASIAINLSMSALKQVVSIEGIKEVKDIAGSAISISGTNAENPIDQMVPYFSSFEWAYDNYELVSFTLVICAVLFLAISIIVLKIKTK